MTTATRRSGLALALVLGALCVQPVSAQFAVIDLAAVAQLIQELITLEQQLEVMRQHLAQARAAYAAITGGRGMEALLAGTNRNYLPADWDQLSAAIQGTAGRYGALAASINALLEENAIFSDAQFAALSDSERAQVDAARRDAAFLQAESRIALANTSSRFAAIQQLIGAIPSATDEKGALDLQARIQAEQGMLQNETTKLNVFFETAQAQEWARRQRARERAVIDVGHFERLAPLRLP